MLHHRQPTDHHLVQELPRNLSVGNLQLPLLPQTERTIVEFGDPFLLLVHQHQIIAENPVSLPPQRADRTLEDVGAREHAARVHANHAPVHGHVDGAGEGVEVGGADGDGGVGGGATAEDTHVGFGAEDGARVGSDSVEGGAFVFILDGEVAVGHAIEIDVE